MNERRSVAGIAADGSLVFIARRVSGGSMGEKWEFPGGKVENGETDQEALIREFQEEFSVSVRVGNRMAQAVFENRNGPVILSAYEVFFESRDFVLSEHTEWQWVPLEKIERLDFADSDLLLLPELRAFLPKP